SELAVAGIAIALAAALVGFPNPPREAAIAAERARPDPLGNVADQAALSVADADGPFVVGLTLTPPEPGPIDVRVQVLGVEAGDGLRDAVLQLTRDSADTTAIALQSCGLGCFKGTGIVDQAGTWRIDTSF